MGLNFKKKVPFPKPFPEKLAKRVSKIPTADLMTWVEQAMSETNRSVSKYMKSNDAVYLEEMLMGGEAVNCLISELHKRTVL